MTVIYCLVPVYLLIKLWKNRSEDLFKWVLLGSVSVVYLAYMYRVGAWAMVFTGHYWRNVVLVAFAITIVKSYAQSKRYLLPGWCNFRNLFLFLVTGFACTVLLAGLCFSYKKSTQVPAGIELDFPLKGGRYYIVQGGNDQLLNHHHEVSAQKYAIDVVKLNQFGFRCSTFLASHLNDYNIFGEVVHSPCDGRITRLINGHEDLSPAIMDSDHPAGNYLAVQIGNSNRFVILAHLMKNSFLVKENDLVVRGQPLAKVGNSGNTSEPHLHMHVVEAATDDFLFDETGIPMRFNGEFLIRNHVVKR